MHSPQTQTRKRTTSEHFLHDITSPYTLLWLGPAIHIYHRFRSYRPVTAAFTAAAKACEEYLPDKKPDSSQWDETACLTISINTMRCGPASISVDAFTTASGHALDASWAVRRMWAATLCSGIERQPCVEKKTLSQPTGAAAAGQSARPAPTFTSKLEVTSCSARRRYASKSIAARRKSTKRELSMECSD